jgi:hypothetical protein
LEELTSDRGCELSKAIANLLLAGVPKAGTTSLFEYLGQHPDICPSSHKGPGYFSPLRRGEPLADLDSYNQYFAHCKGQRYAMEATPGYSYGGRQLLEGIKRVLDKPRIILNLRDPVDRLWSAYTWQRSRGNLSGVDSFERYVTIANQKRSRGEKEGPYFGGVTVGFYGEFVPLWLDLFENDVRIIFTDELFTSPQTVVADLCHWLGIDDKPAAGFDYGVRNKTFHARSQTVSRRTLAVKKMGDGVLQRVPKLKKGLRKVYIRLNTHEESQERLRPETRRQLENMYRESNVQVAEALKSRGYDQLPVWLESVSVSHAEH